MGKIQLRKVRKFFGDVIVNGWKQSMKNNKPAKAKVAASSKS